MASFKLLLNVRTVENKSNKQLKQSYAQLWSQGT